MRRKVKEGQSGEKVRNQARSVPQVYSLEVGGVFTAREEVRNGLRFLPARRAEGISAHVNSLAICGER